MIQESIHKQTIVPEGERYYFLDGLRGWASLAVVFWHVIVQSYPINAESTEFLRLLVPFNGNVAVELFFVISGFALSIGYVSRHNLRSLARIGASRYLRLAIPILAACTLVHFAMLSGIIPPFETRAAPYNNFLRFEPTAFHLFKFSLYDVFFQFSWDQAYIVPLWTMSVELIGSMIAIAFLACFGRDRRKFWILGAALFIVLILKNSFFSLFLAGLLIADIYVSHRFTSARSQAILCCGLLMGLATPLLTDDLLSPLFIINIIILFCSLIWIVPIRQFLENRVSLFLGHISFPLYLLHGPMLWTFSLWLKVSLAPSPLSSTASNLLISFLTVALSIGVAVAFSPINNIAISISRIFGIWLVNSIDSSLGSMKTKPS